MVRVFDVVLVALGAWLSYLFRFGQSLPWLDTNTVLVAFNCILTLFLFPSLGIYQSWRGQRIGKMLWRLTIAWIIVVILGMLIVFSIHRSEDISRLWLGAWIVMTIALLTTLRVITYYTLWNMRRNGFNLKALAVVGSTEYGGVLVDLVRSAPQAGFRAVCVLDEAGAVGARSSGVPVTTRFEDIVRLVRQRRIHEIWLALPLSEEQTIFRFVREFRNDFVNIRFMPDVRTFPLFNHSISDVLGIPSINFATSRVSELGTTSKMLFDQMFAITTLITLIPVFILLAVLVKLSSPGPVFFKQRRKGVNGNEFNIYKFRSMKLHSEEPGKLTQAKALDSRITPIGTFLRKTSLDELPQFINVLRGEMSVVGPRPHAIEHDELYKDQVDGYMYRYRIKPGITGWAQINGYRGETDRVEKMAERVKYDLFYIQNWSFWLDIKIVLLTIVKGFVHKNAY
jgi:putative colanic acid biosynthesis UDP-glucose lipid carrier transferase